MRWVIVGIVFMAWFTPAFAGDKKGQGADTPYGQMNEFIELENDKIKDIKLLNLDLERASLTLKKKEIENKLSALNKTQTMYANPVSILDKPQAEYKLNAVYIMDKHKEALLTAQGKMMRIQEGLKLEDGFTVKSITQEAIVLEKGNGETLTISLEG